MGWVGNAVWFDRNDHFDSNDQLGGVDQFDGIDFVICRCYFHLFRYVQVYGKELDALS